MVKEFNEANKYNLYRSVKDILHPSISKKNVSNYNIIVSEDILPIQVFYPKKITDIKKIIEVRELLESRYLFMVIVGLLIV